MSANALIRRHADFILKGAKLLAILVVVFMALVAISGEQRIQFVSEAVAQLSDVDAGLANEAKGIHDEVPKKKFGKIPLKQVTLLDGIPNKFEKLSKKWNNVILPTAWKLFGLLCLIDFAWTGVLNVLERKELGEQFASVARKILTYSFFAGLLANTSIWLPAIVGPNGLFQTMGNDVIQNTGQPIRLTPDVILGFGLGICEHLWDVWYDQPFLYKLLFGIVTGIFTVGAMIVIMISFGIIAGQLLITLIESYFVVGAGIFLLGFGGSRWTTEMASSYIKYAVAIGVKIFTCYIVVGAGIEIFGDYQFDPDPVEFISSTIQIVVLSFCFCAISWQLPQLASTIISGASTGTFGASSSAAGFAAGLLGSAIGAAGVLGAAGAAAKGAGGSALSNLEEAAGAGFEGGSIREAAWSGFGGNRAGANRSKAGAYKEDTTLGSTSSDPVQRQAAQPSPDYRDRSASTGTDRGSVDGPAPSNTGPGPNSNTSPGHSGTTAASSPSAKTVTSGTGDAVPAQTAAAANRAGNPAVMSAASNTGVAGHNLGDAPPPVGVGGATRDAPPVPADPSFSAAATAGKAGTDISASSRDYATNPAIATGNSTVGGSSPETDTTAASSSMPAPAIEATGSPGQDNPAQNTSEVVPDISHAGSTTSAPVTAAEATTTSASGQANSPSFGPGATPSKDTDASGRNKLSVSDRIAQMRQHVPNDSATVQGGGIKLDHAKD